MVATTSCLPDGLDILSFFIDICRNVERKIRAKITNIQDLSQDELIKDEELANALSKIIELLPDYWFVEAASSTGKYHPSYALGNGGLLRHSKFAAKLAYEMYNDESITGVFNQDEKLPSILKRNCIFYNTINLFFFSNNACFFTTGCLAIIMTGRYNMRIRGSDDPTTGRIPCY